MSGPAPASEPRADRPRVLLTTEGTYPYVMGGVSSWCHQLIGRLTDIDWLVLPIVASDKRRRLFTLPPHARELARAEVWSEAPPPRRRPRLGARRGSDALPATLVRHLIGWRGDPDAVIDAWTACRCDPAIVRTAFRSTRGWELFLDVLRAVLDERVPEGGVPPELDLLEAARLYQTLYWVARTAAVPTPGCDVVHATGAGWASIPAVVHRALHGTPMALTEHGVYVREAYLAAARSDASPGDRFSATRLARGLTRVAYQSADIVAPVTEANAHWELGLGLDPDKIVVIPNGLHVPDEPTPPPQTKTVVSVGRLDPLKDALAMLRVAAETLRRIPDARFVHYGPVQEGQEIYGRSCRRLHQELGLGDRFKFMGPTDDPRRAVRAADVVLMTSISEGMPMAVLEAMGEGRPVVATGVGGVPDVVRGCGVVRPPGDDHGLAMAVVMLLRNPELAWRLGRRGHRRLRRLFDEAACTERYRRLLLGLAGRDPDRKRTVELEMTA